MEEEKEIESLPYPKMDIDYLHSEEHSRAGTKYVGVVTTKIHYLVEYRCCFCDAENRDDTQFFQLENYTQAFNSETRIEKEEKVVREIKNQKGRNAAAEKEKDIKRRNYDVLDLKCRCNQCGEKQPWSDFCSVGGLFKIVGSLYRSGSALFILVIIAIGIILFLLPAHPLAIIGGIILLFVPSIVAMAHNMRTQKKSMRLDERYRPKISIIYKSE